mgnify:CR=1 FL=1
MNIKNLLLLSAALFGSILVANAYEHEWENPTVFERGKEQPHAWFKTSHTKLLISSLRLLTMISAGCSARRARRLLQATSA